MASPLPSLLRELLSRGHRGLELGLDRTLGALGALGDPHVGMPVLHVAGTNGKGSVAAMLTSIAREAGLRTGLYTSPHLTRFAERIQIDGRPIADDAFAAALGRVLSDAPSTLTFFETLTLTAFVAFRDARVDVAVLEVGLGGRLDATNVVEDPVAAAVVSVARGVDGRFLEHHEYLGESVASLAGEKAAIFKRGAAAILGPLDPEARAVAVDIARRVGAQPIHEVVTTTEPNPTSGPTELLADSPGKPGEFPGFLDVIGRSVRMADGTMVRLEPRLPGRHQLENAAVAAMTALAARSRWPMIQIEHVERGIESAQWPGRLERIDRGPFEVWLDCAHNVDGVRALVDALPQLGFVPERTLLVFGALADKAFEPMLELLAPLSSQRFYASPEGRAPAPLEALARIAPGEPIGSPASAIERALGVAALGDRILVAGSIYLVGAVRAHLLELPSDPVVAL